MSTRSDIKREYKETPKQAGVFAIRNTVNGKVYMGSSLNLHGPLNKHRFTLKMGSHRNTALQADWNAYGEDAFTFEILEVVKETSEPGFCVDDELTLLEQIWIEKQGPFGESGYNTGTRIREA
ncbi:MAG: GIY-YIG nuclease family protein [Deltaproteobacteria bacterium]|nr:GIY-YIG nuclease family protein [Deltaproteobacteria bacterium]